MDDELVQVVISRTVSATSRAGTLDVNRTAS
jgi:hypothetical protein